MLCEGLPQEESCKDHDFLERVGGNEVVVHRIDVVGGDEVEGEQGDSEDCHKPIYARALVGREDLPPPDRTIS